MVKKTSASQIKARRRAKNGEPVAEAIPAQPDCKSLIGSLTGQIHVKGDTLSTGLAWNAES